MLRHDVAGDRDDDGNDFSDNSPKTRRMTVMPFRPAEALWNNRERLTQALPEIRLVRETLERGIGGRRDFVRQQWLQFASVVVEFKPDLILELGRGYGNSLCAMALALKMLRPRPARLVSICLASEFAEVSRPHLESHLVDASLFAPVKVLTKNILDHDFAADLKTAERVLVFGMPMATNSRLTAWTTVPLLVDKTHLPWCMTWLTSPMSVRPIALR